MQRKVIFFLLVLIFIQHACYCAEEHTFVRLRRLTKKESVVEREPTLEDVLLESILNESEEPNNNV